MFIHPQRGSPVSLACSYPPATLTTQLTRRDGERPLDAVTCLFAHAGGHGVPGFSHTCLAGVGLLYL